MTTVVHVNSPEFTTNPDAVYIGRAVPRAKDKRCHVMSRWANPYTLDGHSRGETLAKYEETMRAALRAEDVQIALSELKGKVLGCWCAPQPCHGDVLVKLLKEFYP